MKAAFAAWEKRISPVFDVTRQIHLVEADRGAIVGESRESLAEDVPARKALRLAELGVHTLVCGAISRPLQEMVAAHGIRVIPFVTGELDLVIQAWLTGTLQNARFAMPGCFGRNRRYRGTGNLGEEVSSMNQQNQGGMGPGGGRGQGGGGQGGRGQGRRGWGRQGGIAAGPGGACVCPQCGYKEPHEVGIPCMQQRCPTCGVALVRG